MKQFLVAISAFALCVACDNAPSRAYATNLGLSTSDAPIEEQVKAYEVSPEGGLFGHAKDPSCLMSSTDPRMSYNFRVEGFGARPGKGLKTSEAMTRFSATGSSPARLVELLAYGRSYQGPPHETFVALGESGDTVPILVINGGGKTSTLACVPREGVLARKYVFVNRTTPIETTTRVGIWPSDVTFLGIQR